MKSWQFKCVVTSIFLLVGIPLISVFLPSIEYSVSAPRQLNLGDEGSLIVEASSKGRLALKVTVDLIGGTSTKKTYLMKSNSLEIPFNVNVDAPAVLYKVTVSSSKNDYSFVGRVNVSGTVNRKGVYLVTDKLRYQPGERVRLLAMNYSHQKGLRKDSSFLLTLSDSKGNKVEQKTLNTQDGLILDEIELSDKVNQGEWVLSVESKKDKVFTRFSVENFVRREIDLQIECENDFLYQTKNTPIIVRARHFAGGNLDGLSVELKAETSYRDSWEGDGVLKNGEVYFLLDSEKFTNLSEVTLKATLTHGSKTIEKARDFAVLGALSTIEVYPVRGFTLTGEGTEVIAKLPSSYMKKGALKKDIEVNYQNDKTHNLTYRVNREGALEFTIPDSSGTLEILELGEIKFTTDISTWVTRGLDLDISSYTPGNIKGIFTWSRQLYDADKLILTLKEGDKVIDKLTTDLSKGNVYPFKFKNDTLEENLSIEYSLLKRAKVLLSGRKLIVAQGETDGIDLAFGSTETEPGKEGILRGNLTKPTSGVAALIVQDESLLIDGNKEGFALLRDQLIPDSSAAKTNSGPLTFRSNNEGQVSYYSRLKEAKVLLSLKALFWSALVAFVIAITVLERKRILLRVLIVLGVLCLFAAMLLPALGKARAKSHAAKEESRMKNFKMESVSKVKGTELRRDFKGNLLFEKIHFDKKGSFNIPVQFADNLTTWKAEVLGFPQDSNVKYGSASIISTKDLFAEVSLPVFFVKGDKTSLKVTVFDKLQKGGKVSVWAPDSVRMTVNTLELASGKKRHTFEFPIEFTSSGTIPIQVKVENDSFKDTQEQVVVVKSDGLQKNRSSSLSLYSSKEQSFTISQVSDVISQENHLVVYPGSLSENLSGVESMIRKPSGCFEQTSSSNFPNIVAYNYLKDRNMRPSLKASVKLKLKKAYQKLISYEVSSGGFSLYGQSPASPWLTSYGILQFALMSEHIYVDEKIIKRSWEYLKPKLNKLPSREKHFALYCAREAGLLKEKDLWTYEADLIAALSNKNLWDATIASLLLKDNNAQNLDILKDQLMNRVLKGEGFFRTVNASGGASARTEVTALALQSAYENKLSHVGLLKQKLLNQKSNNRWHGTMSTAMALRALTVTEDKGEKQFSISVNGQSQVYDFKEGESKALYIPLKVGDAVSMNLSKGHFLSCHLHEKTIVRYGNSHKKIDSFSASLSSLEKTSLGDGMTVALKVGAGKLERRNLMFECPLPAGFELNQDEFRKMTNDGKIRYHEVKDGNTLVLYLKDLKANAISDIRFKIYSTKKGEFSSSVGKVYEYYKPENFLAVRLQRITVE